MKCYRIAAAIAIGVLIPTASATAWWQWLHQDLPYAPGSGLWLYQNIPQGSAPGRMQPWFWHNRSMATGPTGFWFSTKPMSSLFVEQSQTPLGYAIRVRTEYLGTQDIDIGLEGKSLVIKKRGMAQTTPGMPMQMQQSGWSTQWVSLPADANVSALRISRGNGTVEIFLPRAH